MNIEIWWKINRYDCKIEPVQVIAKTPCFITIKPWKLEGFRYERRVAINGEYFPTFDAARTTRLDQLSNKVKSLREEADRQYKKLGIVFKMEEPTVPQE